MRQPDQKPELTIREAGKQDLPALRQLFYTIRQQEFTWESGVELSDFDESVEGEVILLAQCGGVTAGFVSIWMRTRFIHNLFVADDMRGRGVGSALLDAAVECCGYPAALKCVADNHNARAFYRARGWQLEEEGVSDGIPYLLLKLYGPEGRRDD